MSRGTISFPSRRERSTTRPRQRPGQRLDGSPAFRPLEGFRQAGRPVHGHEPVLPPLAGILGAFGETGLPGRRQGTLCVTLPRLDIMY